MKKTVLLILSLCLLACGGSKTVRQAQKTIKGSWVLKSVDYNRTGIYNIKLLNDESISCFETSEWQFIPNNNTGTYFITKGDCETGNRYFNFAIQEVDAQTGLYDFLLKPTDDKGKSETNKGFRIKLKALSETSMQWEQTVSVEGKPFVITMDFKQL